MSGAVEVSAMSSRDSYEDRPTLIAFLAESLASGRLAIVLGAGASVGFGLPNWNDLIEMAFKVRGQSPPAGMNNEDAAEELWRLCGKDDLVFAAAVREALYRGQDTSLRGLMRNELVSALGALAMLSSRGRVSSIVSFNFDDLLERYLRFYGFDVESIGTVPCWGGGADVRVYHPHGILSSDFSEEITSPIVMAAIHYDRIVGKVTDPWHPRILEVFQSHTCLFIGLSGADKNLTSVLHDANETHVAKKLGMAYWGIRFSSNPSDPKRSQWDDRGVFQHTLPFSELAPFLLEVCQYAAAERRRKMKNSTVGPN